MSQPDIESNKAARAAAAAENKAFLINRRGGYKSTITRIRNKFVGTTTASAGQIETWLKSIQTACKGFDEVQTELERKYSEERSGTDDEAPERLSFMEAYEELEGNMRQLLSDLKQPSEQVTQQSQSITLPQIHVPRYDGSLIGWLSFRRTFPELVGKKPIDEITKHSVLIESCSNGSASELVTSATDYVTAWSRLEELNSSSTELQSHILDQLYDIASPKDNDRATLTLFLNTIETNLAHLTSIKVDFSSWDLFLIHHFARKLDQNSRREMEKLRKPNEVFKLSQFIQFLKDRIRLLGVIHFKPSTTSTPFQKPANNTKKVTTMASSSSSNPPPSNQQLASVSKQSSTTLSTTQQSASAQQTTEQQSSSSQQKSPPRQGCVFCSKNGHSVWNCELMKALTPNQRKQKVMGSRLCLNCLKPNHQASQCVSLFRCKTCSQLHHTLLHDTTPQDNASKSSTSTHVTASTLCDTPTVVLATAIVFIRHQNGVNMPCRAFLDGGSTASFISYRLATTLQLTKHNTNATVVGINGTTSSNHHSVETSIKSRCSGFECDLQLLVTQTIIGKLPSQRLETSGLNFPADVFLADPSYDVPSSVDILLGSDVFYSILKGNKTKLNNGLWLIDTELGSIIAGKASNTKSPLKVQSFPAITELSNQLKKFWEIESLTTPSHSIEERAAENHFATTTTRLDTGRYQVALPFNDQFTELGESRETARRIYLSSERRLFANPEKYKHYQNFMKEMLQLGHMELASNLDQPEYFLTHHMVTKLDSLTTKYRVVFNGSQKTTTGLSLNDVLLIGPVVQPDLFTHLIRWRQNSVGVVADITKMYRQINVRPADRKFQRIWWRQSPFEPLQVYQLTTVTYGTASAPYQATKTLTRLAEDEGNNFLDVAPLFQQCFYVDDLCASFCTEESALIKKHRLNQLALSGGFELRKWSSNVQSVDDHFTDDNNTSVLGVSWNKPSDSIHLNFNNVTFHETVTKTTVLSSIAQIHDPLGLLSPVVLRAKTYMQSIFQLNDVTWDSKLPESFAGEWKSFAHQMKTMPTITTNRALIQSSSDYFDLHGFSDASDIGYGACVYVVTKQQSTLVCAKSRIAPLKRLTTPRLELCAALLLAELIAKVRSSLTSSPRQTHLWTDSEITLFRIKSPSSKYNVYVGSRLAEIQSLTDPADWKHVPTKLNPADLISRGMNPDDIEMCAVWWHGPSFLKEPETWPNQNKYSHGDADGELKSKFVIATVTIKQDTDDLYSIIDKFSSFDRLVGSLAQILRLRVNMMKPRAYRNFEPINRQERDEIIIRLIRAVQQASFTSEIRALREDNPITKQSKLFKLNPFLDCDHILRVGGRLKNAEITFDQQHQMILPKGHFSSLILYNIHWTNMHGGPQFMLASSRQQYWIIGALNECKKISRICIRCYRQRPQLLNQLMGDLPSLRINPARPFVNTGLDFAGPFQVRPMPRAKILQKVYVCLFTCMVTRAVHLELVSDLSTNAFLAAFRRFIARRGYPSTVFSDNATNFVGAKTDLEELRQLFISEQHQHHAQQFCSVRGITWMTIPPRSPHWGGVWESLVKRFKYHLRRVANGQVFSMEALHTIVCQIEALLNSRPLSQLSSDPNDFRALTPGHFLIGQELNLLPEPVYSDQNFNRLDAWQQRQYLVRQLWEKFLQDIIHHYQERNKWQQVQENLKAGQLVLIHVDNSPPSKWPMGRVVATHPGADGLTRMVTVKTCDGTYNRAITKIAALPIED